jgi:hypothetical protein
MRHVCTKRCYHDRIAASMALMRLQRQDKLDHTEQRAYYHKPCKAWHLTSRETPPCLHP